MKVDREALDQADMQWVNVLTLSNSLLMLRKFEWLVQLC